MQRKSKSRTKAKVRSHVTEAFHICDGEHHVVGVKALQVLLSNDGDGWFAQGLQIDYSACGATIDEAKKNFEKGLALTIAEHLRMYGEIDRLLKVAPQDAWNEYLQAPAEAIKAGYSAIEAFSAVARRIGKKAGEKKNRMQIPFDVIHFLSRQNESAPA